MRPFLISLKFIFMFLWMRINALFFNWQLLSYSLIVKLCLYAVLYNLRAILKGEKHKNPVYWTVQLAGKISFNQEK